MFESEDEDFFEGELQNDLIRYEKMIESGESSYFDSERLENIIDHFLVNNQNKKALECVGFALSCYPYNHLFKVRKAQVLSATGKLNEALKILMEVEKIMPNDQEFILTKASLYSQLRQPELAIKYFERALEQSEGEEKDEIFLDLAMEHQNMNQVAEAIKVLQNALKYNPENETALYELSYCFDSLGKINEALQCYYDFIDNHPYSFTAWYNLGNLYSKIEQPDKAIWAYEYSTLANGQFSSAYFNWGYALLSQEKYAEAIESFQKCIEIDGEDAMTLNYIAESYEHLEEFELALKFYKKSTELAPDMVDSWLGIGVVYDLMGETAKGLNFVQKALDLDPENASLWHAFANCSERNGTIDLSLEAYEQALLLEPLNEQVLCDYVKLQSKNSVAQAKEYLENYLQKNTFSGASLLLLVQLHWLAGEQTQALVLYKEMIFSLPELAKALFIHFPEAASIPAFINLHNIIDEQDEF